MPGILLNSLLHLAGSTPNRPSATRLHRHLNLLGYLADYLAALPRPSFFFMADGALCGS